MFIKYQLTWVGSQIGISNKLENDGLQKNYVYILYFIIYIIDNIYLYIIFYNIYKLYAIYI